MLRHRSPKTTLFASCTATVLTAVAIFIFGAPPITLVYVAWGGPILFSIAEMLTDWHSRRRPPPFG